MEVDTSGAKIGPLANQLQALDSTADRRQVLLDMKTADASWSHRPVDPNLDMVSADMVEIVAHLLNQTPPAPSPPITVATLTPGPNEHGWHNEDVVVTLRATPGPGGVPVAEIQFSLAGAQPQAASIHDGNAVDIVVSSEGDTVVSFFARDTNGTVEATNALTIRLDKTPPSVAASPSLEPNAFGWNNADVTITFSADDALSGVNAVDPPATVSTEGAGQEVIGTATDFAGNSAAVVIAVSIDKTAPTLRGLPAPSCTLWPPNHDLLHVATVSASDALSGVAPGSPSVVGASNEPQSGTGKGDQAPDVVISDGLVSLRAERAGQGSNRIYTVTASARDQADNLTTMTASCVVPHDQRGR